MNQDWFDYRAPEYYQKRNIPEKPIPRVFFDELRTQFAYVNPVIEDATCLAIKAAVQFFPTVNFSGLLLKYTNKGGFYSRDNMTVGISNMKDFGDAFFIACHEFRHVEQHQRGIHNYKKFIDGTGNVDHAIEWKEEIVIPSITEWQRNFALWSEESCRAVYFKAPHEMDANGFAWSCCNTLDVTPTHEIFLENKQYAKILF